MNMSDGSVKSTVSRWKFWRWALHWQIILAIAVGGSVGWITESQFPSANAAVEIYGFVGNLFLKALGMLVVPLIASSMVVSMSSIARRHNFARLGVKTLVYYVTTSLAAILVGVCLVNITRPGEAGGLSNDKIKIEKGSVESAELATINSRTEGRSSEDMFSVVSAMIPKNIVGAASDNNGILGVITFSLLFGFFLSRVEGKPRDTMEAFWEALYSVMTKMTEFVIKFLPIGVGFMIAGTVAKFSAAGAVSRRLEQVSVFALTVLLGLAIHMFVTMPLILRFIGKVSPIRHFKAMGPAILTAFSTASSSATLPLTLKCARERAGVSRETSGFTLPLGATVNMDGTALYECVAVLFVAQLNGVSVSFGSQVIIVALALMTSIGVAGIPSASLVAIVIILNAMGPRLGVEFGYEAIAVIMIFDRVLDMCRTAVNVFGDSCGAVVIAKSEGETGVLAAEPAEMVDA